MPPYATEADVRLRFQLNDEVTATPELIAACLEEAHDTVVRFTGSDAPGPPATLVLAETLLAGAAVFRSLLSRCAQEHARLTIGGQVTDDTTKIRNLEAAAAAATEHAWHLLEACGVSTPAKPPADVTPTTAILGDA